MKYDAFISYRRENGFFMAQVIRDHLSKRKINCFLDLEELSSGKFDEKLLEAIQSSSNFIIVLTPGSLDRCIDENDWMRKEIIEAFNHNKTIIPIMYEGFKWSKKWENNIPNEVKALEKYQAVPGTQVYLSAMIDKIISFMTNIKSVNNTYMMQNEIPVKGTLHIATSNLTVIDSIMQGWDCKSLFKSYGFTIETHPYKWSDKILSDLLSGNIDIAIYNKESCINFNKNHNEKIHILRDVCSSMGGRNFYILASKNSKWTNMTLEQFKQNINETTIIAVSKSSDMYKNFLYILDMTEQEVLDCGVKFMDYHSDQGLEIFKFLPDLLMIAGQDIRFLAEQSNNFFEIISYDDFPQDKKDFFFKNSINSLLIGPSAIDKLSKIDLNQLGINLMLNFYKAFMDKDSLYNIRKKLAHKLSNLCDDEFVLDYVVKKIIFETYRFI